MSDSPRVTIRDIAAKANMHFTTVSLALRNSPRLKAETREKIQELAKDMGYRPDAMLAALNAYRQSRQPVHYQAALAWVHNWRDPKDLYNCEEFHQYFLGARERAQARGYNLEEFWLQEPGMTIERLHRILRARNIRGVLLAPQPQPNTFLDLHYDEISAVAFGYSMQPAVLDLITNHHVHTMNLLLEKVLAMGYRRIGLCIPRDWNDKVERAWQSSLLLLHDENPDLPRIPIHWNVWNDGDTKKFTAWMKKHRAEVIISYNEFVDTIEGAGFKVPGEVGFASLFLNEGETHLSGVHQNDRLIGQKAVDMVIDMLHRGETGIPRTPVRTLVEGEWYPGQTLSDQTKPAPLARLAKNGRKKLVAAN